MKFNIENYESMSTEEKLAALEAYEPDMSGFVSKSVFDKTASEAASYKKQLREKMTEDEAKAAKEAEEREAAEARTKELEARVNELEKEKAIGGYANAYLAMGYDEKMAKSSAEALVSGDMETVFKNQKIFGDNREKALRTELLKQTPPPASGDGDGVMGKDVFAKLSLTEKQKLATENPELYKSFYENKED
jgi:hypothetical protein